MPMGAVRYPPALKLGRAGLAGLAARVAKKDTRGAKDGNTLNGTVGWPEAKVHHPSRPGRLWKEDIRRRGHGHD